MKFLQKALSQLHVLPILCSAQHLRMPWDGWGSGGGRIQMAHLWNPAGHSEPPFTHHQLDWHPDRDTTVAAMCRAECPDAAPHAYMLVLLLADLRPFDVEATIQAPTADSPRWSRLLSFLRWRSAFEKVIGPRNSVVKVFADMRKHSDATNPVLGQNLAVTYEINAGALTAVDRPVAVCASSACPPRVARCTRRRPRPPRPRARRGHVAPRRLTSSWTSLTSRSGGRLAPPPPKESLAGGSAEEVRPKRSRT